MNWLDIVFLLIFAAAFVSGATKGLARQLIGFVAAVLGFFCALWFYGAAGSFLLPYVSHKGIANFIGFLLIFLGIAVLGALTGKLASVVLKWAGLSWLDRLMGAAFGLLQGLLFAIVLVLALMAFSAKPPPRSVVESRFAPYAIDAACVCAYLAPREVREAVKESYEKAKEAWAEAVHKVHPGAPVPTI